MLMNTYVAKYFLSSPHLISAYPFSNSIWKKMEIPVHLFEPDSHLHYGGFLPFWKYKRALKYT